MNYDLIIKLAKLANNNPNENEANLAARKVCKLLAEENYQFNGQARPANNPTPPKQPVYNRTWYNEATPFNYDYFEKFFRERAEKSKSEWGNWVDPPPRPKTRAVACCECGVSFFTTSTELYPRCLNCVRKKSQKDRTDKTIHQCVCGERKWWYSSPKASWICSKCAFHISITESTAKNWKMA